MRSRHVADYQKFYNRVKLRLGTVDHAPQTVDTWSLQKTMGRTGKRILTVI